MPPKVFLLTLAAALLVAMLPMPYGYYQLLRLVACGLAAWAAAAEWQECKSWIAGPWALLAILYNPVLVVHFDRETWVLINLASAVAVVGLVVVAWRKGRSHSEGAGGPARTR